MDEAVPSMTEVLRRANRIYQRAIARHEPSTEYALFSGGDDSLVLAHWMMERAEADEVVHINTGIGIPETREYIEDVCEHFDWPLKIVAAEDYTKRDGTPDPQVYEQLVLEHGFPGPGMHWKMWNRLKERPVEMLVRNSKQDWFDRILLGTGRYRRESRRRMELDNTHIDRKGAQLWVNPFLDWYPHHLVEYRKMYDLPRNPVAKKLCMSGECLCGAYAKPGELEEILAFYPETGQRILDLQEKVIEQTDFDWGWNEQPGDADDREMPPEDLKTYLCASCAE